MKDTHYAYAVAYMKTLENKMLTGNDYEALLSAPDFNTALKIIADKGYGKGRASGLMDGEEDAIETLFDLLITELICDWMNDNTTWCDERCQWAEPCYRCIHEYIEAKGTEPRKPVKGVLWGKDAID